MDNDAKMLKQMGNALVDLQVKYRGGSLNDRMALKPVIDQLIMDYAEYQLRLLKEGVITTDEDLNEMDSIKKEIDAAADKETMLKALAKTITFIAVRI